MRLRRITPNVSVLDVRDTHFLFFKEDLLAIESGGFVYHAREQLTAPETRAINFFSNDEFGLELDYPVARVSEAELRFIVGSSLTREGLPMTRLEKKDARA